MDFRGLMQNNNDVCLSYTILIIYKPFSPMITNPATIFDLSF